MTLYCGIDLHSTNNYISVLNENDKPIFEKRLPNDLERVRLALAPFQDGLQGIVVESTYNWYWLVDGLMETGYNVHLANTIAMRQYDGIKYTDDLTDARYLAHLLRLGILPEGYIYPKEARAVRDLLRKRLHMVQQRVTQHLSLQSHIARQTGIRLSSSNIKQLEPDELKQLFSDANVIQAAEANLSMMKAMDKTITAIETAVLSQVKPLQGFKWLRTTPGIGPILGMTILLEAGNIHRFPNAGNFASYCRCVKTEKLVTVNAKGWAIEKMATNISPGPFSKRRSRPRGLIRKSGPTTSASRPKAIALWRSRLLPTNWPRLVILYYEIRSPSMLIVALHKRLFDTVNPQRGLVKTVPLIEHGIDLF